jgi:hypothetical protein
MSLKVGNVQTPFPAKNAPVFPAAWKEKPQKAGAQSISGSAVIKA